RAHASWTPRPIRTCAARLRCIVQRQRRLMSDPQRNRPWLWAALIGCACLALCIARFGTEAGSTWDEPARAEYGDLILRWLASGFRDTRAAHFENLFLEGGLFEIVAQSIA